MPNRWHICPLRRTGWAGCEGGLLFVVCRWWGQTPATVARTKALSFSHWILQRQRGVPVKIEDISISARKQKKNDIIISLLCLPSKLMIPFSTPIYYSFGLYPRTFLEWDDPHRTLTACPSPLYKPPRKRSPRRQPSPISRRNSDAPIVLGRFAPIVLGLFAPIVLVLFAEQALALFAPNALSDHKHVVHNQRELVCACNASSVFVCDVKWPPSGKRTRR